MDTTLFTGGTLVLPDRLLDGHLMVRESVIAEIGPGPGPRHAGNTIDLAGRYLTPGYIDLHVHGGADADFMDASDEAFRTVCAAHLRHGTTSLLPTSTVASHEQILAFLECNRRWFKNDGIGSRPIGAHFYGPYFAPEARGCHPAAGLTAPAQDRFADYLKYSESIALATVAPELPGAEAFARAAAARGIRLNAGHSYATFAQVAAAVGWGVRHVDHLFCAMSDRSKLRQSQTYPMRGGLLEATLFFDELTTEVIADGKHLNPELLKLACKIKGPDRLALVTDCNRALDCPDGEYIFGPKEGGERIQRRDGVGIMPDGKSLASGVMGMDHMVRTFRSLTGAPLVDVIRMATLTPARIAGCDDQLGSLAPGKIADLLILDSDLNVCEVYQKGRLTVRNPDHRRV